MEPGDPLEDVAQVAWYSVPLRGEAHWQAAGFTEEPDAWGRLETLCTTYGAAPQDVLDTLVALQRKEMTRTMQLGEQGIEPWRSFLQRGDVEEMRAEAAWLAAWYDSNSRRGHGL